MATDPMALANALDPSLYSQQLQAQQQAQLAQLLMQQGLAPMGGTESVGGVAIRRSPMEGAAKLAALLSGQSMMGQANQSQAAMMANQSAAMRAAFGMGGGDAGGDGQTGQPAPMPSGQGPALGAALAGGPSQAPQGPMSVNGASPMTNMMSYMTDPAAHMKAVMEQYAQTPEMKMAAQVYGAGSPQYMAALRAQVEKAGIVPPNEVKPGVLVTDARTNKPLAYNTGMDKGIQPTWTTDANGFTSATSAAPVPGYAGANATIGAAEAKARTAATNSETPATSYEPKTALPIQTTKGQQVSAAQQQAADAESLKILQMERSQTTDPAELAILDKMEARIKAGRSPLSNAAPEQAPGVIKGADDAQKQMGERFSALRDTVSTAQTTNSYLDNIKQLSKTAVTGPFSDKTAYVQALVAPFSTKADQSLTDKQLLDKYSNQIVSKLSTGGLGTDAARTILGSAYPGSKMTEGAIAEAVDNIKSVNNMVSAKLSYVQGAGNARDHAAYQQKEQQFDQVADPRVWQLHGMNPEQARAFLSKMPDDVKADLVKRATALRSMGVL